MFEPIKHNEQQQRQEKYNPHCYYIPIQTDVSFPCFIDWKK